MEPEVLESPVPQRAAPEQRAASPQPPAGRDKPAAKTRGHYQRRKARLLPHAHAARGWTDIPGSRSRGDWTLDALSDEELFALEAALKARCQLASAESLAAASRAAAGSGPQP